MTFWGGGGQTLCRTRHMQCRTSIWNLNENCPKKNSKNKISCPLTFLNDEEMLWWEDGHTKWPRYLLLLLVYASYEPKSPCPTKPALKKILVDGRIKIVECPLMLVIGHFWHSEVHWSNERHPGRAQHHHPTLHFFLFPLSSNSVYGKGHPCWTVVFIVKFIHIK